MKKRTTFKMLSFAFTLIFSSAKIFALAPSITVTELTVPSFTANVNETKSEKIHVSGENLTEAIVLNLSGDASMFELSSNSIPQTSGTAASTEISITYKPTAPGSHSATLTLSSASAENVTRTLNGAAVWKPLAAPVAVNFSSPTGTGFTANWETVAGATEYELNVYTKANVNTYASDLFFSEYVLGSANNKAAEIYNGTGAPVLLSAYKVSLFTDGASTTSNNLTLPSKLLQHNDVYVVYHSSSVQKIKDVGDVAVNVYNFDGNDALVLKKGTTVKDCIGQVGFNPGTEWAANGVSTKDKTLVRKPTIHSGNANATSAFDPSVEWIQFDKDNFDNLGSHSMDLSTTNLTPILGSPFTVTDGTSKALSGLNAATTYYYTVKAKNANVTSPVSNEILASTMSTKNCFPLVESPLVVSVVNASIKFNSPSGQSVEVYNAVGQKIINKITIEGANVIPVSARGVVIVKVGNRIAKVIL